MTLNLENYQNTVRNTNENTILISQNRALTQTQTQAQTQPSEGFKEIDYLETLEPNLRVSYIGFRYGKYCCSCCCCSPSPGIRGSICNQITKCIINLIFVVGAYFTSYSNMEEYKELKDDYYIKGKEILKKYKIDLIYSSYSDYQIQVAIIGISNNFQNSSEEDIKKAMNDYSDVTSDENGRTVIKSKFKCENITYHENGRVATIKFKKIT